MVGQHTNNNMTEFNSRDSFILSLLDDQSRVRIQDHFTDSSNLDKAVREVADDALLSRIDLLRGLAELTNDHQPLVATLAGDTSIDSLRDIAKRFNVDSLNTLVEQGKRSGADGDHTLAADDDSAAVARMFRQKLFVTEPDAVLWKMISDGEIPVGEHEDIEKVKTHILGLLDTHQTLFSGGLASFPEDDLSKIDGHLHHQVRTAIHNIQRIQSLSTAPAAISAIMKAGFTSAQQIACVPASNFAEDIASSISDSDTAQGNALEASREVHAAATSVAMHADMVLTSTLQLLRGTGIPAIDGPSSREERVAAATAASVSGMRSTVNMEQLFGSLDFCDCSDCTSVTSPAAYLVEILQFLRNNNLKEQYNPGWNGTALEMLLRRRPDLVDIKLTCANTNTVLPYIDLGNEIMESFIVHLEDFIEDNHQPKQVILHPPFNTDEEDSSSSLLSQPFNVNYEAYCKVKDAVYPFDLPYHQPLDEIRALLDHLGISRHELINTFRREPLTLQAKRAHQRAYVAEVLGISMEEHLALTHQSLYPKEYFEEATRKPLDVREYEAGIQLREVYTYWGYGSEAEMLSETENDQIGLNFVKAQFLPRSGISYANLVDLLRTKYINPNHPSGWALLMLQHIRYSYRYLATLVNGSPDNPKRFDPLIDFLARNQPLAKLFEVHRQQYLNKLSMANQSMSRKDLEDMASRGGFGPFTNTDEDIWRWWVTRYFDLVGKLLVLDSGDKGTFGIEGWLILSQPIGNSASYKHTDIGYLQRDGQIMATAVDGSRSSAGYVNAAGVAIDAASGIPLYSKHDLARTNSKLGLWNVERTIPLAWISKNTGTIDKAEQQPVQWQPIQDTCNMEKTRLVRLDGQPLSLDDCDRMHRFIRLWRRLGWSIDELDHALLGFSAPSQVPETPTIPSPGHPQPGNKMLGSIPLPSPDAPTIKWSDLGDRCDDHPRGGQDTPQLPSVDFDWAGWLPPTLAPITPEFLEHVVNIKKLLRKTSLDLAKLLTFWSDISTQGQPKSLYASLFLTRNLLGMDRVFEADAKGNYLAQSPPEKLLQHAAVLMAALQIRSKYDLAVLVRVAGLPADPDLTLQTVSRVYRVVLLVRILNVKSDQISAVIDLLGDPFGTTAKRTIEFLEGWECIVSSGVSLPQIVYILREQEVNLVHQMGPSITKVLQGTKQILDGLDAIDKAYPDTSNPQAISSAVVVSTTLQAFDPITANTISGIIEGTAIWQTNAPPGLVISVPNEISRKLRYTNKAPDAGSAPSATVTMVGILTTDETRRARLLSSNSGWAPAIDRLMRKPVNWFKDTLSGVFPNENEAMLALLVGDEPPEGSSSSASPGSEPNPGTAPGKRAYFLTAVFPFYRDVLYNRFLCDVMTPISGLSLELTQMLLRDIIKSDSSSALAALRNLRPRHGNPLLDWAGYLIPPTNDTYTFFSTGESQPPDILLDGAAFSFKLQMEDPTDLWATSPTKLVAGRLYELKVLRRSAAQLHWKSERMARSKLPPSVLLPITATRIVTEVFTKMTKAGLLVKYFGLTAPEITFFTEEKSLFDGFDLDKPTLAAWQRLHIYISLRNGLSAPEASLVDLFKWAAAQTTEPETDVLVDKILLSTRWDTHKDVITALLKPGCFKLTASMFKKEDPLVKLKTALDLMKRLGSVDVGAVFKWANPLFKFWEARGAADDIRKIVRARYSLTEWEAAIQPLYNKMRENQKNALISYLLVQPAIRQQGIANADGLFEFFLIDVQMSSCLQTSRIKQAISSIQLFIQRCLLGLELDPNKGAGLPVRVDPVRWSWMEKYRVWEANRKVFLYPENWLIPGLRDDKSQFYRELEGELLQKDVDNESMTAAFRDYLVKVDEVANLEAQGLFFDNVTKIVHIVARTRTVPYMFYYRNVKVVGTLWSPWEKMAVDIPNYTSETMASGKVENGTFVTPVVWQGRLLVFFPQFVKKTFSVSTNKTFSELGSEKYNAARGIESWDIKMCFSERQEGGLWTAKVMSTESVCEVVKTSDYPTHTLPDIKTHVFRPWFFTPEDGNRKLLVDVFRYTGVTAGILLGAFDFVDGRLLKSDVLPTWTAQIGEPSFGYWEKRVNLYDLQLNNDNVSLTLPLIKYPKTVNRPEVFFHWGSYSTALSHPFVHKLVAAMNTSNNLSPVFDILAKLPSQDLPAAFGYSADVMYHELKTPYAIYNWEVGLHAPLAVIDKLVQQKHFDKALELCHLAVFNPMTNTNDVSKCWQFRPFQEIIAKDYLESFLQSLLPNQQNTQVSEWRDNPFAPHVVARSRPVAYMKAVVSKYIDILVQYGDYYFRQNTLETLPLAIQMYVRASHIFGPSPQLIPKRGKAAAQTYRTLMEKLDAFSNAAVDLELEFPYSNQIVSQLPIGYGNPNGAVDLPNIFGSSTTRYFCIPNNPQLRLLRSTIDDRLFKLRHCQDINGVVQSLPLFEAPIDPAVLVQATAAGVSISSVLNDMSRPMSNYRFVYLIQKAHEMCAELKGFLAGFLAAKEKRDGEAMVVLRQRHEITMNQLALDVKRSQLDEANCSLDALRQSRASPAYRLRHYAKILGVFDNEKTVPSDETTPFIEIPQPMDDPLVDEGGLVVLPSEKLAQTRASQARKTYTHVGILETISGGLLALPTTIAHATPLGVGVAGKWGIPQLGHALTAAARGLRTHADYLSSEGSIAGTRSSYFRAMQDRVLQANIAGQELKSIDAQILTQKVRVALTEREIAHHQQTIQHSTDVAEFLATKYSNVELYSYLEAMGRQLAYQAYTAAYDLAKRAEQTYYFERPGDVSRSFISFGYWDPARDGLLAGETLGIALRELEAAYQEKRGHDFEVVKNVSLRLLAPLELVRLRETGRCEFSVPEVLFDMDFPGHYMRRIRSVQLSIPCVVGPHAGVNATLRLLEHKFRSSNLAADADSYPESLGGDGGADYRFSTSSVPISAMAASIAQGDTGVFELNMKDERFLPFEGAGAISRWRLTLPTPAGSTVMALRPFDYGTITDVILQIRYTALDGGGKLAAAASGAVCKYVEAAEELSDSGGGLYTIMDLRADFASEWYRFITPPESIDQAADRTITMRDVAERLPVMTRGASKLKAMKVTLYSTAQLPSATLTIGRTGAAEAFPFTEAAKANKLFAYTTNTNESLDIAGSWILKLKGAGGGNLNLDERGQGMWIIVQYSMKLQ